MRVATIIVGFCAVLALPAIWILAKAPFNAAAEAETLNASQIEAALDSGELGRTFAIMAMHDADPEVLAVLLNTKLPAVKAAVDDLASSRSASESASNRYRAFRASVVEAIGKHCRYQSNQDVCKTQYRRGLGFAPPGT